MFTRKLTKKEIKIVEKIIRFIEDKHCRCEGHDYSHVLEVTKYAIQIGRKIKEKVDPFVLICGALLHDIGRINAPNGLFHAIDGAARAEEYLESLIDDEKIIKRITKVIVRHSYMSGILPEAPEEKIIFDADDIERLGLMGMIRGIMGKEGTIEGILEDRIKKRVTDFSKLYYKESREIGDKLHKETMVVVKELRKALDARLNDLKQIENYKMLSKVE